MGGTPSRGPVCYGLISLALRPLSHPPSLPVLAICYSQSSAWSSPDVDLLRHRLVANHFRSHPGYCPCKGHLGALVTQFLGSAKIGDLHHIIVRDKHAGKECSQLRSRLLHTLHLSTATLPFCFKHLGHPEAGGSPPPKIKLSLGGVSKIATWT